MPANSSAQQAVKAGTELGELTQSPALEQYVRAHTEQPLLAYILEKIGPWMRRARPAEADKFVMLRR